LVKTAIKAGRLAWLKNIDKNLKTSKTTFGNTFLNLKRNDQSVIQLKVGTKTITEPQFIAEAFANISSVLTHLVLQKL
jgi:hypothetical protein